LLRYAYICALARIEICVGGRGLVKPPGARWIKINALDIEGSGAGAHARFDYASAPFSFGVTASAALFVPVVMIHERLPSGFMVLKVHESVSSTKRTSRLAQPMSAFGGKADIA
jgi:hypothetical protein